MSALAIARVSALHALDRAEHLLALGKRADCLGASLAPGMMGFADQIGVTASFARRATVALVRADFDPTVEWDADAASLGALLSSVRREVEAVDGPTLPVVVHVAGTARLEHDPDTYVARFALPNLWFHLTAAYAILRAQGVAVGKADFDGLHAYPAP